LAIVKEGEAGRKVADCLDQVSRRDHGEHRSICSVDRRRASRANNVANHRYKTRAARRGL
jgi:hypothetical protein